MVQVEDAVPIVGDRVCAELPAPSAGERDHLLAAFGDRAVHAAALRHLPVLQSVEVGNVEVGNGRASGGAVGGPGTLPVPLRVTAWNAERGAHLDAAAALLARTGADVHLLSELDCGMARSGQRHTARELSRRLGCGYAYAVEFVELGLGNRFESASHAGEHNEAGLHGAAVLARAELRRPIVVRFDASGAWFTDQRDEARVGGRMAVAATAAWAAGELVVASAHLESHSDPAERAHQMGLLLGALDDYAGARAVVLGGDCNTFSASAFDIYRSAWRQAMAEDEPTRFVDPVPYEPLFEVASHHGYTWQAANAPGPTQRTGPSGRPKPPLMRLDWFFTRGVEASDPATVPAIDDAGTAISDHDLLAVTVAPRGAP